MSVASKLVLDIALQASLLTLFLGSLFTFVVGVALSLGQRWVFRLNEYLKRWVSLRDLMRPRDVEKGVRAPHQRMNDSPDRWVASSPKWFGIIIALASLYVALMLGYVLRTGF